MSDSLWPHESQHTRPPCPSPASRVYSNSCPSSRWCHPAISSSVVSFSSCPQSLPALGSFPMSQLFAASLVRQRSCTMLHPPFSFCSPRTDVLQGLLHSIKKNPCSLRFLIRGMNPCHAYSFRGYCFWWGNWLGSLRVICVGWAETALPVFPPVAQTAGLISISVRGRHKFSVGSISYGLKLAY